MSVGGSYLLLNRKKLGYFKMLSVSKMVSRLGRNRPLAKEVCPRMKVLTRTSRRRTCTMLIWLASSKFVYVPDFSHMRIPYIACPLPCPNVLSVWDQMREL